MVALIGFNDRAAVTQGRTHGYGWPTTIVEVTISVTRKDPAQQVVCIVRARSLDGGETGRRELLVPPSTQATVQVSAIVKSSKPPVVGDVYGCGTDVPTYLRAP